MDKPTGNQTKTENSSGDTTPSQDGNSSSSSSNNSSSSCGGNNNIDLGCGPTSLSSTSTKLISGSTTPTGKTTIPSPLAAAASSISSSVSSTLQQATMPRFVSSNASNTQQQQQQQPQQPINLSINTTTGGNFDVTVDPNVTVENLKKIIAKKLKVAKDRIRLLHRERELQDGSLKDNNLMDGSKIILIPNVETGLLAQRPENTVMQALESLNDSQVNDFLSGKTPLNLSMRLGDHMMLIQLQLSTVNPANGVAAAHNINGSSCSSSRARSSSQRTTRTGSVSGTSALSNHHTHHHHHHHHHRSSGQASTSPTGHTAMAASSSSLPITMLRKANGDTIVGSSATNSTPLTTTTSSVIKSSDLSSFLSKRDYESLQNIVKSIAMTQPSRLASAINTNTLSAQTLNTASQVTNSQSVRTATMLPAKTNSSFPATHTEAAILDQSPIKSLSNLVSSSPIETTTIKNIPTAHSSGSSSSLLGTPPAATTGSTNSVPPTVSTMLSCQDPIAAKLTSCLCTRLNASNGVNAGKNCVESSCLSRQDISSSNGVSTQRPTMLATSTPSKTVGTTANTISSPISSATMLHKTANNPIVRLKHRHHHHHHHHHHHYHHHNGPGGSNSSASSSLIVRPKPPNISPRCISIATNTSSASNDSGFASDDSMLTTTPASTGTTAPATTSPTTNGRSSSHSIDSDDSSIMTTDTRTLAEASRNLTQTLRKLSKEVFTNKIDLSSSDDTTRKSGSGAVIESMKNHGKGIYSGTFSGTLNPALQDRYGRPKRDISTVIHILNDLLSATPQYSRGARISFESPTSSGASSSAGNNLAAIASSSRSKQLQLKHAHSHSQSCVKCLKAQAVFGQHSNSNSNNNNTSTNATNNSSANCVYGECNGHYSSTGSSKNAVRTSHYACCSNIAHNVNGSNPIDSSNMTVNDRNVCSCRYRITGDGETTEREREHTCQKCLSEMEMLRTKSKLDQLRLVMQQRKQKREARKLKGSPYGARVVGATTTTTNIGNAEISESTSSTTVAAAAAVASTVDAASLKNTNTTTSSSSSSSSSTTLTTAPPSEVSPNHIVEEVDTAA